MIVKADAVRAIDRLAPMLGKHFDDIAQAELVRRLCKLNADIDLDAVVTAVILDGSKYEAALRNFTERVDRADRQGRGGQGAQLEHPARRERPDAEIARALREDAARFGGNPRLRRLSAIATRRADWLEAGRPTRTPPDAAVGVAQLKSTSGPSGHEDATEST